MPWIISYIQISPQLEAHAAAYNTLQVFKFQRVVLKA